jgi:hypothetical protein
MTEASSGASQTAAEEQRRQLVECDWRLRQLRRRRDALEAAVVADEMTVRCRRVALAEQAERLTHASGLVRDGVTPPKGPSERMRSASVAEQSVGATQALTDPEYT